MVNVNNADIYTHLYGLFNGTVSNQIYFGSIPTTLGTTDSSDFLVIKIGVPKDNSEFGGEYGYVRVYVETYFKSKDRGRMDLPKYRTLRTNINNVLVTECGNRNSTYPIRKNSILCDDDFLTANSYHYFTTSFRLLIK